MDGMHGEYTIKRSGGRSLMIIDTGNAIWVGLWGLVLEMGWRNQAETFAVADMCDHVGYFAWRDCWRDCDSGRQYPFVTGDDIFRLQANAPDQEKAKAVVDQLTEFEEKLRAEQSKAGEEMRAPAAPEDGKIPEKDPEQSAKADGYAALCGRAAAPHAGVCRGPGRRGQRERHPAL